MSESERQAVCSAVVQLLRAERLRQKWSMRRLAAGAGLSQAMISLVENDLRNPTLDTLLRMTGALQLDLGRLILKASAKAGRGKRD